MGKLFPPATPEGVTERNSTQTLIKSVKGLFWVAPERGHRRTLNTSSTHVVKGKFLPVTHRAMERMPLTCGTFDVSPGIALSPSSSCRASSGTCRPPTTSAICATKPLSTCIKRRLRKADLRTLGVEALVRRGENMREVLASSHLQGSFWPVKAEIGIMKAWSKIASL